MPPLLTRGRLGLAFLVLPLTSALGSGCSAPHKLISARHTSCSARKLEIRELTTAPDREDWIAVCGERSYACSTREQGRRLIYACKPLKSSAAEAGAPASAPNTDAGSLAEAGSVP